LTSMTNVAELRCPYEPVCLPPLKMGTDDEHE
jgi:hypothetical protein